MIRKILCLGILLLTSISLLSAQQDNEPRALKSFVGQGGGIVTFEGGYFALWGYATVVPGKFTHVGDHFHFVPNIYPAFRIFARTDSKLKDKKRIRFENFGDGASYLQFDEDIPVRLFDEGHCFSYPYVKEFRSEKKFKQIKLTAAVNEEGFKDYKNSITFSLEGYNDFIIEQVKLTRYNRPFSGKLLKSKDGGVLNTNLYDEFQEETAEEVNETMDEYSFFAKIISKKFDAKEISISVDENFKIISDNEDDLLEVNGDHLNLNRHILKYKPIHPIASSISEIPVSVSKIPLFVADCRNYPYSD